MKWLLCKDFFFQLLYARCVVAGGHFMSTKHNYVMEVSVSGLDIQSTDKVTLKLLLK